MMNDNSNEEWQQKQLNLTAITMKNNEINTGEGQQEHWRVTAMQLHIKAITMKNSSSSNEGKQQ